MGQRKNRVESWFSLAGVSDNQGFEKSGVTLQCCSEENPTETTSFESYEDPYTGGWPIY